MTRLLLATNSETAQDGSGYDEVFLWNDSSRSSFTGSLEPSLSALGPIGEVNSDFVRVALGVFAADRSVRRKGRGADWNARDLHLTVQIADPGRWQTKSQELTELISFLTGDRWSLDFVAAPASIVTPLPVDDASFVQTVLLSGGADSAAGALYSALQLQPGETQALVSHFSSTAISPFQKSLADSIAQLAPRQTSIHFQVNLNRGSKRLDRTNFRNEPSSRSRSLLFLALGLAVASRTSSPLLIPENGFASLNPPLGPERRGALSTRTTHPRFLHDLEKLLAALGAHSRIENPFQNLTKGQMFALIADQTNADTASRYLSATNSCSHTDAHYEGAPPGSSCGVCFGCIVRRAAFKAAGLKDRTTYLSEDPDGSYKDFVQKKSIEAAVADFCQDEVKPRTVMAMSLSANYRASDALDLCRRGAAELREYIQ
ncbi:7-cyano-7-deazaguanine synthase [Amycolatopsis alkalitolerans]|uniref:7-cyano-7-deazaguanine synthase n=1 Tax=Amycolatopsis alkalitolerans TaxID=2547244 RepID=A0A5C4LYF3_9PSEU|nr:7-cyano-7-deazaguanine synthase [Amycolatopsis alkalitolerans]TNC23733.1 hypothetical protein FG385_20430 [Amycolatopsis alkalitolerans]